MHTDLQTPNDIPKQVQQGPLGASVYLSDKDQSETIR